MYILLKIYPKFLSMIIVLMLYDNLLLHQIASLGLKIRTIDNPFVVHQWHYTGEIDNVSALVNKNAALYNELSSQPFVKGVHLITPDL